MMRLPTFTLKSKIALLVATWVTALANPTSSGMEMSIMGTVVGLEVFTDYFEINEHTNGLLNASICIGGFLMLPFARVLMDRLGRKNTIFISNLLMALGVLIQSTSGTNKGGQSALAQFVVGRIISGSGNSLMNTAAPPLVAEIIPSEFRGLVVGAFHSCYYVGSLIAAGVTYGTRDITTNWCWRAPLITQYSPIVVCLIALCFVPESPRWLVTKGREQEALEIFTVTHDGDVKEAGKTIENVKSAYEAEKLLYQNKNIWRELTMSRANLQRVAIVFIVAACSETSGSSVATYYITTLLEQAGIKSVKTQLQVAIIRSAFCLVAAGIGCLTFDILGRKPQALIAMTGQIITFFILGALIKVFGNTDNTSGQYGAIAMMFLFSGFYSYCFTPLLSLYPPEVFPQRTRAAGVTVFQWFDTGLAMVMTFVLPIGMANMKGNFYLLNASWNVLFIPAIYFLFVETKGATLEKIADLFGDGEEAAGFNHIDTIDGIDNKSDDVEQIGERFSTKS